MSENIFETYRYLRVNHAPNEYPSFTFKIRIDHSRNELEVAWALCGFDDARRFSKKIGRTLASERLDDKNSPFRFVKEYDRTLSLKENVIEGIIDNFKAHFDDYLYEQAASCAMNIMVMNDVHKDDIETQFIDRLTMLGRFLWKVLPTDAFLTLIHLFPSRAFMKRDLLEAIKA